MKLDEQLGLKNLLELNTVLRRVRKDLSILQDMKTEGNLNEFGEGQLYMTKVILSYFSE